MHYSSYLKARLFVRLYGAEMNVEGRKLSVLEVGSKSHHEQDTYRDLFPSETYDYTGLDIEAGRNVDIVPANPFVWNEIDDCSFDLCVSGQTFEHNPYFWITFAEIARVLRPGGLALVVAPGAGHVHRYPVDCWRFYPDSWPALAALTGLELVETYLETDLMASRALGGAWRDSAAIVRKPRIDGSELTSFHSRLTKIVAIAAAESLPVVPAQHEGRWVEAYKAEILASPAPSLWRRLKSRMPRVWKGTDREIT